MDISALRTFAQDARRDLISQVRARLDVICAEASDERRDVPDTVKALEAAIRSTSREQVIEKAAYTWFNRFSALMFMDRNGYNAVRIVTPNEDDIRPAILSDALGGHVDESVKDADKERITGLLNRTMPSREPELEAYKLLLASACQTWHQRMPFMFGKIEDWTELLMPGDLLAGTSVLTSMRAVMTPDACEDVEIIGWLYQFYISEKKDEVFADLKKNVKITAENIPAATQLFTPHWIVRYLVENSLGRLWLLNRPESGLAAQMDYYIAPEEPETDFLRITRPEDIRICDPACGSGHMLTYAFDLLTAIYEEEGYDATEIPTLILRHNLTGVEIDDRAGALAAFALVMKAAARLGRRRFLHMETKPDICVLQNVSFTASEMQDVAAVVGEDLFTDELRKTLDPFGQARTFGSLIEPKLRDPAETLRVVGARDFESDLLLREVQDRVVAVLRMADALSPKYHVVVANPPYMGRIGMNGKLRTFAKAKYPDSKSDLFAMFMERALALSLKHGMMAMITMQSWMFLSTFEKLRRKLLSNATLFSMAHLGERAFDTIGGAVVSTTAFVFQKSHHASLKGDYVRLIDGNSEAQKALLMRQAIQNHDCGWFHRASAKDFENIPGSPIAYWVSQEILNAYFAGSESIGDIAQPRKGLATSDNNRFLRSWHEISIDAAAFNCINRQHALESQKKWFPHNKGGPLRKWFGNNEFFINWEQDGKELLEFAASLYGSPTRTIRNIQHYFKDSITWSAISSSKLSVRKSDAGFVFDTAGQCVFSEDDEIKSTLLSLLNSTVSFEILKILAPTLNFNSGVIAKIPFRQVDVAETTDGLVRIARADWDAFETSWDFTTLPLLDPDHQGETLEDSYAALRAHWQGMTDEMQRLEEENNRIFIDAYGLQDELTPDVPIEEITLTCNPAYRFKSQHGSNPTPEDLAEKLKTETVKEFISYAVGCMFGRYSLDAPGLILANVGETLKDYLERVPEPTFMPDEDNVIPMLDGNWFPDDITQRFRDFLRVTFGEAHFVKNLEFIETSLGKDIRRYFLRDFYTDHVKRYKKRPIYWLFSSPNGHFNALIYMHCYRSDTVSVVLNDYLRDFKAKLVNFKKSQVAITIDPGASGREKTRAGKEIDDINKALHDIEDYENEILFPLAEQQITIDLDDGVKQNYPKFGKALKKVTGLSAK